MSNLNLKKDLWLPTLCLIAVGGFIYSFNLNNKLFWDDDEWIVNNIFVHEVSWSNIKFWFSNNTLAGVGLKSNYYRPFLFFTFAFNYIMSGIKPLAYHLTSDAIHIFNSILVFWLIRQIFKRKLLAFLVSILFLVHPLQTEAITYISGRGDALVAMFMLLALLVFAKNQTALSFKLYALSITFLVLGLLSRETGIIFPALALALYVSVFSNERFVQSIKQGLIKTWPYFAVVIVYGILRLTVLNFLDTLNFYLEPNVYSENLHIRIFTFLPILWEYLKLLIVPTGLHMERGGNVYTSLFQWPVWLIFLGLIGLLAWLRHLYKKALSLKLKAESYQVWLFGSLWFFIALGPVSGITPINALMYEHWLYLPMVGFWLIVSFYLVKLFDYLTKNKNVVGRWCSEWSPGRALAGQGTLSLVVGLVIYFSFFGYQSIRRNILWGNSAEFYKDILKYEPDSARINNNLGNTYFNQGDKKQAEFYYRKAVESGDAFAQPYYNLGSMLQSKGDIFGAIQLYEKAIEINPNFYYPYQNLAGIYAQQGNLTKAVENIEILKSLLPNNPRVYYNSALIYIALNNKGQALIDLRAGLKYANLDPQTGELMKELIEKLQN